MKKLFVLILIIFLGSPVFAEYVPIPEHLSKQYKKEIEYIIDEEYHKAIKNVDNYVYEAKILYKRILKNGYFSNNQMDVINLNLLYDNCLSSVDLDLYVHLIKITQEKYLNIVYKPIGTDWVGSMSDFMQPYFLDNNIDTRKLDYIIKYESKKSKIVKKYIKKIQKLRPNSY